MEIGGPDDVQGMKDGDGFIIVMDGIGVLRVPAVVDEKWPTFKDAILKSVEAFWREEHARQKASGQRQQ